MSASINDRITELSAAGQDMVTGIDFIYVYNRRQGLLHIPVSYEELDIYFLKSITDLETAITPEKINIYSPFAELPKIEIDQIIGWREVNGKPVLHLKTKSTGDFSIYNLRIDDEKIDPYFNDISFSFKANCSSDLDCKPDEHECPPEELVDFPIDYLARDFWSYRRALLDFASLRYPGWTDRLEADSGVMLAEVMSAVGDEMAYYQDRISREAYLETATQRRSIRTHAHLIDYYMHDGLGSKAWIEFTVDESESGDIKIPPGLGLYVNGSDNTLIYFETGNSIQERIANDDVFFIVNRDRNQFDPHIWDDGTVCLPVGTTEIYLKGDLTEILKETNGKWILLQTNPLDADQPARAQMVHINKLTKIEDKVFNEVVTHVIWYPEQALKFEFDLTILKVKGNMVPATAGKTGKAYFVADKCIDDFSLVETAAFYDNIVEQTIERRSANDMTIHLASLPGSAAQPLVFLGKEPHKAIPEIILQEMEFDGREWVPVHVGPVWECKQTLVGINSSGPSDKHFMLDDGTWQRVAGYRTIEGEFIHRDYASNNGITIRFGDGEFGKIPNPGTVFRAYYRLGGGLKSNVASGTIKNILEKNIREKKIQEKSFGTELSKLTEAELVALFNKKLIVNNPLGAAGGLDAETSGELKQLAPDAFRAITYRAVRPEDYAQAAETLQWVQKAGAEFRWTGSWLSAFVTPDPKGKLVLDETDRMNLQELLNRYRQAGREVHISDPQYANIDLKIHICVSPDAYPGKVKERVNNALMGTKGIYPKQGYFSPDRFTFGTMLDRSTLEAAIQEVPGVKAVERIEFRRRGTFEWKIFLELSYNPGANVIIRIANDLLHPERGILKLYTHGGL